MSTQRKANRAANIQGLVVKEDDEERTAAVALVEDAELAFPVKAGGVYKFEVFLRYQASDAASQGLDLYISVPAGTTGGWFLPGPDATQPAGYGNGVGFGVANEVEDTSARTSRTVQWFNGIAEVAADGAIAIVWGSNVANASTLTMHKGSYIEFRRLV